MADAGRRAIQKADSIEQLTEFNRDTLKSAETANRLAIYGQQRIGELLRDMPKAKGGEQYHSTGRSQSTSATTLSDIGISKDKSSNYQNLAKSPEIVEQVLREAQENGRIVSMAEMQRRIKEAKLEGRRDANRDLQRDVEAAKNETAAVRTKARETEERLKAEIAEMKNNTEEAKSHQKLLDNSFLFCSICHTFLKQAGGLGFIADQLFDLPPHELSEYKKAIFAVLAWAQNLSDYIGG